MTLSDVECFLRDAGGFSRSEATGLLSRIKSIAHGERGRDDLMKIAEKYLSATINLEKR